jgi:hypothetical protein
MAFRRLELPPPRVLLLVLSAFLGFLALEGFLLWAYGGTPLRLSLLDLLFWGALMLWSVSVRVPLPLSASMSQFLRVLPHSSTPAILSKTRLRMRL